MNILLVPNTNSLDSYLSLADYFNKKKIKYKLLIIHKSVEQIIIKKK